VQLIKSSICIGRKRIAKIQHEKEKKNPKKKRK
jgi:hypothetical protein